MNQRLFLMFFSLATLLTGVTAQRYVITGTVKNGQTGSAVEFASVTLLRQDSTIVGGIQTDETGSFKVKAKTAGNFILRTSYMGFTTLYKNVQLTAQRDSVNVGALSLQSDDKILGTAVVSATLARVEQKEDTTMYNAAAYRVPDGSTLEALIKQLPGVEVSDDGTIKWNGKEVKEFLINGKDFFKGDTEVAMKNLPNELVNKIKAYDKKSDYTEMTGIDDGEETTVLDISTKRELNESWVTNVDLAYGTKDRYAGRFFATRFTDRSRITAYGSANNTGNQGFGGPRGFGGGGSGLRATKNAGLDFSWENGKSKKENGRLELGGNIRYSHSGSDNVSTSSSETFLTTGSTSSFSNSWSKSKSGSTNVNGGFRVQWSPDTLTKITFRPSFSYSESDSRSTNMSGTFNDDPYAIEGMYSPLDSIFAATINPQLEAIAVNRNNRLSMSDSRSSSFDASLNIMRRLNNKGRNVSLQANGGYSQSKSHSYSLSEIKYFSTERQNSFLNQYSYNPSKNHNYSIRLGYVEPLGKQWFGEAGYKFSYRYSDSDRSRYNLDSLASGKFGDEYDAWGSWETAYALFGTLPTDRELMEKVRDDYNSQYATYKYFNHTANIGVRYNTETIRFNAGVDFNPERTEMSYMRPGQHIDTLITRTVFKVSPQIRMRYRFSKTTQLDIRYRGSSSQPSMTDLLAVVDDSDPLNVSMGNPGLKPSWTNNLRIFYNSYNPDKQQGMMAGLNFSQVSNSISSRMVYDQSTGARYTRPENISGNWNSNANFMFNTGLGYQKLFTISTFTRLSYNNQVGYVSNYNSGNSSTGNLSELLDGTYDGYNRLFNSISSTKNTTRTLGVGENLNLAYRASWFDIGVFGSLDYQHARATAQDRANMDTWNFAYGANANFNFDWGMSISTDIRMNSRRGYSDASMNTNEFLWNAQIAQSFLKGRAATISLQFYDILHKQSNVSRTISATMRRDSWNNAINSYIMLHFIYKLNIFGGKSQSSTSGKGQGRREGGNGSMRAMPMMRSMGGGHGGF